MMTIATVKFSKSIQRILLTLILTLTGVASSLLTTSAKADVNESATLSTQNKQYSRGTRRGGRIGGGPRDPENQCPTREAPVIALVPALEDTSSQGLSTTNVGGVTTSEHPTFWFYVPYSFTNQLTAEFILQNEAGQTVYTISSTEFPSEQQTPGVIGIAVPMMVTLEPGQVYQWFFKFNCGSEAPIYVSGGIERIPLDPDLANQLAQLTPVEQVQLYQQNEIWYDALDTVAANLHRTPATDATTEADWNNLLESIGLTQALLESFGLTHIPLPAGTP